MKAERYECGKTENPNKERKPLAPNPVPKQVALKGVVFSNRALFSSLWENEAITRGAGYRRKSNSTHTAKVQQGKAALCCKSF